MMLRAAQMTLRATTTRMQTLMMVVATTQKKTMTAMATAQLRKIAQAIAVDLQSLMTAVFATATTTV